MYSYNFSVGLNACKLKSFLGGSRNRVKTSSSSLDIMKCSNTTSCQEEASSHCVPGCLSLCYSRLSQGRAELTCTESTVPLLCLNQLALGENWDTGCRGASAIRQGPRGVRSGASVPLQTDTLSSAQASNVLAFVQTPGWSDMVLGVLPPHDCSQNL